MVFFAFKMDSELFESKEYWDSLAAATPVMRALFIVCYILFAVGLCISVFRKYEINYMHIF
jgi:hypothetical protein